MLSMQLPAKPAYTRVKLWRQLRDAGAISIAGGVHLLPNDPRHRSVFQIALDEVVAAGGRAAIFEGGIVAGVEDPLPLFQSARCADYQNWIAEADALMVSDLKPTDVTRMRRRLEGIRAIDFFPSGMFHRADKVMRDLVEASLRHPDVGRSGPGQAFRSAELRGRVWVTRRGMGVDRIASAWLIRRFIDPRPRFRFVDPERYVHQRRELRFDMAGGEFTHEGDLCSFETLLRRADVDLDRGLEQIAMIIHDLDVGDGRYDHPKTHDLASAFADISERFAKDEDRLQAGSAYLDGLHESLDRDGQRYAIANEGNSSDIGEAWPG